MRVTSFRKHSEDGPHAVQHGSNHEQGPSSDVAPDGSTQGRPPIAGVDAVSLERRLENRLLLRRRNFHHCAVVVVAVVVAVAVGRRTLLTKLRPLITSPHRTKPAAL